MASFQAGQEIWIVAIVGIRGDAHVRHAPSPCLIEQVQGNLRLGLKGHVIRYAGALQALGVFSPCCWQVQAHRHRPTGSRIAVATRHRYLTVAHLAQRAGILTRHSHRGLALFGKPRIVEDQQTVAYRDVGDHLFYTLAVEIVFVPLHVAQELLQALFAGSWDGRGHGVTVFIGQFGE